MCLKRRGHQMCTFGVLGLSCETPSRSSQNPPKFNEKTHSEREKKRNWWRETENKARNFGRSGGGGVRGRGVRRKVQTTNHTTNTNHHTNQQLTTNNHKKQQTHSKTHTNTQQHTTTHTFTTNTKNNPHQDQPQHNITQQKWIGQNWIGQMGWPRMDWPKLDWPKSAITAVARPTMNGR